jgi:hypothetical protein
MFIAKILWPAAYQILFQFYYAVMVLQAHSGNVLARALILSWVGRINAIVIAVPIEYSHPAIELIISIAVRRTIDATAKYGGSALRSSLVRFFFPFLDVTRTGPV